MPRLSRSVLIAGATFVLGAAVVGLGVRPNAPEGPLSATGFAAGAFGGSPSASEEVVLVDQGLGGAPIGTQPLPEGWTVEQNLATHPTTGETASHHLVMRGPRGEAILSLGSATYGGYASGGSRDEAWQRLAATGLDGVVRGLAFGAPAPSPEVEAQPGFRRLTERAAAAGLRLEGMEVPFRGERDGRPVEGLVQIVHGRFSPEAGMVQATALVAPAGGLDALRADARRIAEAYRPNPEHEQRVAAIGEQYRAQMASQHGQTMQQHAAFSAQMQAGHQQRMAGIQASGAAHQQRMQGMWSSHDAQMAGWQAQQATSDEMHRQTINGIRGTADVYDAQTGTTYRGVDNSAGAYWTNPTTGAVVGTDAYSDNPDPYQYNQGTNLDDM